MRITAVSSFILIFNTKLHNKSSMSRASNVVQSIRKNVINLMSDTVTLPTKGMQAAMANAKLGDDVYGADPSVNALQEYAAEMLGKEAALFVPSGTMSNLIAIGMHCQRGDEIIVGNQSHVFKYEGGGASALLGVSYFSLPTQSNGTLSLKDMQHAVRPDDPHCPRTSLVTLENTHNTAGGKVLPLAYIEEVAQFCRQHKLKFHIDGARLANASVASGISMDELVKTADSVSVCLSKGLGAPVGSVLIGKRDFIQHAKRLRKMLGGGMRQAGVIASAGKYALEHQMDRLAEDHEKARLLGHRLSKINGIVVAENIETNMVYFNLESNVKLSAAELVQRLREEKGVIIGGGYGDGTTIRAVLHLDITLDDVSNAAAAIRDIVEG